MTPGRKPINKAPDMEEGLPRDLFFLKKCDEYLDSFTAPDPPFVISLMEHYLETVASRKLTGPEVAASVEDAMIRHGGTLDTWCVVIAILTRAQSFEAVKQHYKRYKTLDAAGLESARELYLRNEKDRHASECRRDSCELCGPPQKDRAEKYKLFRELLTELFGYQ